MTLHERITQALEGTTPGPWQWEDRWQTVEDSDGDSVARYVAGTENGELIAAAPGLLAEAQRRLDPGTRDVAEVVADIRHFVGTDDDAAWLLVAADLLAQAFLDPQEPTDG